MRHAHRPANDNWVNGIFDYFADRRGNAHWAQYVAGGALAIVLVIAALGIAHELGKL